MKTLISLACIAALAIGCGDETDSSTPATVAADSSGGGSTGGTADATTPTDASTTTDSGGGTGGGPDIPVIVPDFGGGTTGGSDGGADTQPPPDSGGPTVVTYCRTAFDCVEACDTEACRTACAAQVDASIKGAFEGMTGCVDTKCSGIGDGVQCWLDNCGTELNTCFFEDTSGAKKCSETVKCIEETCPVGKDLLCIRDCLKQTSAAAQLKFIKFQICVDDFIQKNCPMDQSEQCYQNARSTDCNKAASDCLGDVG